MTTSRTTTNATITITVNIAAGNKWEGNSEYKIDINEDHLRYIDPEKFDSTIETLIRKAILDYRTNNEVKGLH